MAGIKISALPPVTSALTTDIFPVVQAGVTSRETLAQLATLFNSQLTFLPLIGGTMSGAINMGSHQINAVTDPTSPQDAATKNYVDTIAQGLTIQGACRVATTGALTVTYANGASGVGATLTNAGAQAALSIDSVSLSVNDRVLVKNQASSLQNGIYTVTDIGSGATNWVMTRATDYNQPAQINPGDLIIINAGSTNTGSSWIETATVVTVGVSSINFSQFSASLPISLANGGTSASLSASNGGIFYSTSTAGAILSGTAIAGQLLTSGASTTPAWTTSTYPTTNAVNTLLYASSANVMGALATANTATLQTNSSGVPAWSSGLPIKSIVVQSFPASATYTPTPGMVFSISEVCGSGGAGGSVAGGASTNANAGGGQGGGYVKVLLTAAQIGGSQGVTIGAGGTVGSSGNNPGNAGGTTSLGSLISITGGAGGQGNPGGASIATVFGGSGGAIVTVNTGTVIIGTTGWNGENGSSTTTFLSPIGNGAGGNSYQGKGGQGLVSQGNGNSGSTAAGGSGGCVSSAGTSVTGGAGGNGYIVITEFIAS